MLRGIFKKNEKGFTLVEIILVSVIVLLIGVAIIVPFRGGKESWQGADKGSETIQNAVVGMEKVVRELKNSPGLTAFENSKIRFAVLREDTTDIDGDGNTTEYVEKYAMVKRDGDYLKYGERDADTDTEGDWTLSDLAYPVTSLTFNFKKADGTDAIPGTDDPEDVKSVLINLVTSDGGVTIPLTSRAFLVMNNAIAFNFDGTPDDPAEPGPDEDHFNEGNEETDTPPPPGSLGDGVPGWGITDYVIWGDEKAGIRNNVTVNGNVGTRTGSNVKPSEPYIGENSVEINGYLVVKGTLKGENAGVVNNKSVLSACAPTTSYAYPCSTSFKNNAKTNGYFWTLRNIGMENSSQINKTVHLPYSCSVPEDHLFGNPKKINFDFDEADPSTFPTFMEDPMDFAEGLRDDMWGTSVFPMMPPEDTTPLSSGALGNKDFNKKTVVLPGGDIGAGTYTEYGDVTITNSSHVTINPNSKFRNFEVRNSSYVVFASTGNYYFENLEVGNSAKLIFDFSGLPAPGGAGPIRLYIKDKMVLVNSSSFDYLYGGEPINGANLLYVEPYNGFSCSNSVQWRGFIYSPNGDVEFANNSSIAGGIYSKKAVKVNNHTEVTYVPPLYMDIAKLLDDKFYPHVNP